MTPRHALIAQLRDIAPMLKNGMALVEAADQLVEYSNRPKLTDDEIHEIVHETVRNSATRRDGATSLRIARAIEARVRGDE